MSTFKDVVTDCILRNDGSNMAMYRIEWSYKLALVYLPFLESMSLVYISADHKSAVMSPMITEDALNADDWIWHRVTKR